MLPDTFWQLTPADTRHLLEGFDDREEARWERAALVAQYTVAPWTEKGKSPPSIDKILGRTEGGEATDREDIVVFDPDTAAALRSEGIETRAGSDEGEG